jgi:hypothetical protein
MGDTVVDGRLTADGQVEADAIHMFAALSAERDQLRGELAQSRAEKLDLTRRIAALEAEVAERLTASARVRLPVLCRDLKRWSTPAPTPVVAVAVAVGPPPLPPSLDDLASLDQQISTLKRLLRTPAVAGKPFHTQFDIQRFQLLQAKLKEAGLLAERLISQVERSRNQKEMLWHLMVAQRTDELNRKRR